jgi:predicted histidine transporter YuiF (NhaC family)
MQENQSGLKDMSSDKTKEQGNSDIPQQPEIVEKKSDEEHVLKINMNKWGIAFFIMFGAVFSYLMVGVLVFLRPFEFNIIDQELVVSNPALLTALIVIALVFLGLGYYFGWVRKPKETEEEKLEEEPQQEISKQKELIFSNVPENEDKESS